MEQDPREKAAAALEEIDPSKPYGTELFNALCRLTITLFVDAVALRRNGDGQIEVYLAQRAESDSAYPGEWHFPGSAQRPGQKWPDAQFARLAKEGFLIKASAFLQVYDVPEEARGHWVGFLYIVELDSAQEDEAHGWFPVAKLPEPMVAHHRRILPAVVEAFVARKCEQKGEQ